MANVLVGLIVAVIAGLLVLVAEYKIFQPKAAPETPKVSVPATSLSKLPEQKNSSVPIKRMEAIPSPLNRGLAELHKTAKSIQSPYSRDLELARLADYAVRKNDMPYALAIAKDISSSYSRDLALGKLVDKALETDRFDIATQASESMSSSYSQDLHLSRVLKARLSYEDRPKPTSPPAAKSGAD